jgi:DNA replication ATP-dependent helicase Dna2
MQDTQGASFLRAIVLPPHSKPFPGHIPDSLPQLREEHGQAISIIHLCDSWAATPLAAADIVNIIMSQDAAADAAPYAPVPFVLAASCSLPPPPAATIINDVNGHVVIHHPDVLVSATQVGDGFVCTRRAVIAERFKETGSPGIEAVVGQVVHAIFERCLLRRNFTTAAITAALNIVSEQFSHDAAALGITLGDVRTRARTFVQGMVDWAKRYTSWCEGGGKGGEIVSFGGGGGTGSRIEIVGCISSEQNVWSPRFGVKGIMDAVVEVSVGGSRGSEGQRCTWALELKTGKEYSIAHRSQAILYSLMMCDVHSTLEPQPALLLYLSTGDFTPVIPDRAHVRAVLQARNRVALGLRCKSALPQMLQQPHTCSRCFSRDVCMTVHRAVELGTPSSSGCPDIFNAVTQALSSADDAYVRSWLRACDVEEFAFDDEAARRRLWNSPGTSASPSSTSSAAATSPFATVVNLSFAAKSRDAHGINLTFLTSRAAEGRAEAESSSPAAFELGDFVTLSTMQVLRLLVAP